MVRRVLNTSRVGVSSRGIRIVLAAALTLLSGCGVRRYYPVCVYGTPPSIQSENDLTSKLSTFVAVTAGGHAKLALAPNDRLVVVDATKSKQALLRKAWPTVACIGPGGAADYGDYKACVDYLMLTLQTGNGVPALGEQSDAVGKKVSLFCGNPLPHGVTAP